MALEEAYNTGENSRFAASYAYDARGNRTVKTQQDLITPADSYVTNYTYDGENTQFMANYAYDVRGNRTAKAQQDLMTPANSYVTNYTYDIGNKLLKKSQTRGQTSDITNYQYDANGNVTAKLKSTVTQGTGTEGFELGKGLGKNELFRYNAYGQLVKYETGGITAQYAYDPAGLRTGKTVNGTTTTFVNDRGNVIMEGDSSYNIRATYVRGYNLLWSYNQSGEKTKYTYNAHGDVVQLANGYGTITKTYGYDAFGNVDNADVNDTNPFRYCGEYFDNESGNIYLRARYYDPGLGRFISEDPIKDGDNWYIYCYNNPVMLFDPFGLAPTVEEAAAMAEHIYGDYDMGSDGKEARTVAGWRLIDVWNGRAGMKMGFYIREGDDWKNPSEYVIVFKGTSESGDWTQNWSAYNGKEGATDMWDAMNYSKGFVDSKEGYEITFVGHSKGGGEAIAAATYTHKNAITFNAANFKFEDFGLVEADRTGSIDNYYIKGEILSGMIGTATIGTTKWLEPQYYITKTYTARGRGGSVTSPDTVKNHSMAAIFKALGMN